MGTPPLNIVTGAFGYSGRHIAQRLLDMDERVRTLTNHPTRPHPFGDRVTVARYDFAHPARLAKSLEGASTLYNTYWIRFAYRQVTFDQAIQNSRVLFTAAREAGIRRVVHLSITNPSEDSPLPYFKGKALVERALRESGLSYAIIRPTMIFGPEDILLNNIAWCLRTFPVFPIPGSGRYALQPVSAEDVAEIAVRAGHQQAYVTMDAAGPKTYTYEDLVRLIARAIGRAPRIVHVPPALMPILAGALGVIVRDVVLTRDEAAGLMAGLLVSKDPSTGSTSLSAWLRQHAAGVGRRYASEVARHFAVTHLKSLE
ncbi:MAG: NAD(P)H-binding protein [Armatimonadetes bacterium]|nr:NAD(P)H-binding protein [Armatimonadota bacterium]